MPDFHDEYERIKDFLKHEPRGMNIREISQGLDINRNSVAKYLDILTTQEEVEVRIYGKSKIYNLSQRVPISGLLKFSSNWIIILNRDLCIVQTNDAFLRWTRMHKEKILHRRITDIPLSLCTHPVILDLAGKALAGREAQDELALETGSDHPFFKVTATPTVFQDHSSGIILVFEDITDKKTYETALKNSEEKFRNLVETSADWIWEVDCHGKYTYSSPQVKAILGYEPEEIIGKTPFDLMLPEEAERVSRIFLLSGANSRPVFSLENTCIHKAGHLVTLETNGMPFQDKSGAVAGYRGIDRDITERKRTQDLAGQYQFLQQLIDTIPNPVYYKDIGGVYRGCNRAFETLLGRSRTDIVGKNGYDLFPEEHADIYSEKDHELFGCPGTQIYEYVLPDHFGINKTILFYKATFTNADGSAGGLVGVLVDITERKHAEEALRGSEERYRTVFETNSTATIIIEPDTTISLANSRFESLSGYSREEIVGKKSWTEFIAPNDLERMKEQHSLRRESRTKATTQYEFQFITRSGELRDIVLTVDIIPGTKKSVASLMDITERKRTEERLSEVNNAFLAFGPDPVSNISILTGLAGKMLKGTCAFYNRLEGGMLHSLGTWNAPPGYVYSDRPEGHICNDIIQKEDTSPSVITNLLASPYADSDPNVRQYQLQTYIGVPVKIGGDHLGSLCVVYRSIVSPSRQDLDFLSFLAKAVAVEDERRIAQMALHESEERFRMLLQNVPSIAVQGYNLEGTTQYWNAASEALYGYTAEEAIGRNLVDLIIPPELKGAVRQSIRDMERTGRPIPASEVSLIHKDGTRVEVFSHHALVRNPRSGLELFCIDIDLSERKRVEEALRQANWKLNLLSGITRHDIRNQLLALSMYIYLIEESPGEKEKIAEYTGVGKRIINTISQQISFTKEYEEIGVKAPAWQNISTIITNVIARSPLRNIRVDPVDPALEVYANLLLENVFSNLFDHAVLYGGEQMTFLRVTTRREQEALVICVEDDGQGIAAEDKIRLFSKGFGKQSGPGLYLSREILSITGITITETGDPGKGARFEIVVPAGMYRFPESR